MKRAWPWRTEIPNVHVASADKPGTAQSLSTTPGTGFPTALAMSDAQDGGVFLAGRYWFHRNIDCGDVTMPCGASVTGRPVRMSKRVPAFGEPPAISP